MLPPRGLQMRCLLLSFLVTVSLSLLLLCIFCWCIFLGSPQFTDPLVWNASPSNHGRFLALKDIMFGGREATLRIASQLFVISLPRRNDRRYQMGLLRGALGLQWSYIDAIDAEDPLIDSISTQVRNYREIGVASNFQWPDSIDSLATSYSHIGSDDGFTSSQGTETSNHSDVALPPLTCATEDNTIPAYTPNLPQHLIFTRSRIACWHSHLTAIHQIVTRSNPQPAIILEDDIDMEQDIRDRLQRVWPLLPTDWDIVFLGHCWSNESYFPPLGSTTFDHLIPNAQIASALRPQLNQSHQTSIHPSNAPKCTHAYALSRTGARRLWLHLTYPPFAYSRAIDQALAWLIVSGRLKSFSIVPSVVIQRKIEASDIMSGTKGSGWKDTLFHGVFDNAGPSQT